MSLVLQVFGYKPKYRTPSNFDLMMALEEKSENYILNFELQPSSRGEHECLNQSS